MSRRMPAVALFVGALTGCALNPKPVPTLDLPKQTVELPPLSRYWQSFGDPVLDRLIDEALAKNVDVLVAQARIAQAREALFQARSDFFPSFGATLEPDRSKFSNLGSMPLPSEQTSTSTNHRLNFEASYEVDLWGRTRALHAAAGQDLDAAIYLADGARNAVAAQTARSYFALRTLDAEAALLTATLATRDKAVELQRLRLKAGLIDAYAFSLTEAERHQIAALQPGLESARQQAEIALAVLLGRTPSELAELQIPRGLEVGAFREAVAIPEGLPADLLLRRPDVRAAEAQLVAASFEVEEVRRRFWPRLTLTGALGAESSSLSDLLKSAARTWNVAALIAQPIFGLTKVRSATREAEARRQEVEILYQQAARQAYGDALTALALHRGARESLDATDRLFITRTKVRDLAQQQFDAGLIGRLDLLDAERFRLEAERAKINAEGTRRTTLVDVYQALGGGFELAETGDKR